MPKNNTREKRHYALEVQKKRQEERLVRKVSSEFDEKCKLLEAKMEATNEKAEGLTATLEDVIEGNRKLTESVLNLMDMAKLKDGPNCTRRKLERLENKYVNRK